MSNRTARKRYRRREARLKATAGPKIIERWGWGEPTHAMFADLALIRRAIRERWPTHAATSQQIVEAVRYVFRFRRDAGENEYMADRLAVAAVRTLLDIDLADALNEPCGPTCRADCAAIRRRKLLHGKSRAWRSRH